MTQIISLPDAMTLQRGFDLPSSRRQPGPYPVIASTGTTTTHMEAKVKGPGVVIGRSGSIGGGQYIADDFWPLNTTLWVKDFKGNNEKFIYYLLKSLDFSSFNAGAAVPTLNRNHLSALKVRIPSRDVQDKVADILGTVDEKIELNRRMNETLEQMGQALFRHYFITNLEAEKWSEGKLEELTDFNKESIGKDYPHDQIQYVDISSVSTGSVDNYETIELSSAPSRAKRIVRDSDIVWAMVRPNRRAYSLIMKPADNMVVSTGFAVLSPKRNALGFVYYHTSSQSFADYLTLHARGAAYPAVTASDFKNAPIVIPDANTLEEFNKRVLPNLQMMSELKEQIQTLTTLRDTLLPRLINGKIKV